MNAVRKTLIGSIGMVVVLTNHAAAGGLPDIFGIQLGMPAREAHAKLQGQFPKNNLQVMSTNLPTIEKPVISSFQSLPKQTIMMGDEADTVTVDVTLPPKNRRSGGSIASISFLTKAFPRRRCCPRCARNMGKRAARWHRAVSQPRTRVES